jgi:hypothetical protein
MLTCIRVTTTQIRFVSSTLTQLQKMRQWMVGASPELLCGVAGEVGVCVECRWGRRATRPTVDR